MCKECLKKIFNYVNAVLDKIEMLMNFKNKILSTEIEYFQILNI